MEPSFWINDPKTPFDLWPDCVTCPFFSSHADFGDWLCQFWFVATIMVVGVKKIRHWVCKSEGRPQRDVSGYFALPQMQPTLSRVAFLPWVALILAFTPTFFLLLLPSCFNLFSLCVGKVLSCVFNSYLIRFLCFCFLLVPNLSHVLYHIQLCYFPCFFPLLLQVAV